MENKKRKIVIFLLVIAIFGLSLIGIFSYSSYVIDKPNKQEEHQTYEKLSLEDELVINLFDMTGSNGSQVFGNTSYENVYFTSDKTEIKKMPLDFKLLLTYYNIDYDNIILEDDTTIIKEEYVIAKYKELFGDVKYEPRDINAGCPSQIKYNKEKKQYEYNDYCGGIQLSGSEHKLIEARKYSERIEIYNKVAFYLLDENVETISYWKNSNYSDSIITLSFDEEFNIDNYLSSLNTYKYTFSIKGEKYYFEKVEKLK